VPINVIPIPLTDVVCVDDYTRVVLEREHGSAAGSDYINASYIKVCYVYCTVYACTVV